MGTTSISQLSPRLEVAKEYCRTIAVIDDEIFEEADARRLREDVNQLRMECEKANILCHLHHYNRTLYSDTDSDVELQIEQAFALSNLADIIVLDWNLGDQNSHDHAIELVKRIEATGKLRFVLIYTQQNVEDVAEILRDYHPELSTLRSPATQAVEQEDGEDASEIVSGDGEQSATADITSLTSQDYHIDYRFFLFVRHKKSLRPDRLVDEVHGILHKAFPDFLHWAGLELAVKTRAILPELIGQLPVNTDGALMHQMLYQKEDEVAQQVSEVLLDELETQLNRDPLTVLRDEQLFESLKANMQTLSLDKMAVRAVVKTASPTWQSPEDDVQRQIKKLNWTKANKEGVRKAVVNGNDNYFPRDPAGEKSCRVIAEYIKMAFRLQGKETDYRAWARLREAVLLAPDKKMIWPGYVLRRLQNTSDKPEWLLCISPLCDCYRPKKHKYLFVGGTAIEAELPEKVSTLPETQVCVGNYQISWDASELLMEIDPLGVASSQSPQKPTMIDDTTGLTMHEVVESDERYPLFEIVGMVRTAFTNRIIQRVWTHNSRVGVDSSELFRVLRGER